jgi:hypothetical protein
MRTAPPSGTKNGFHAPWRLETTKSGRASVAPSASAATSLLGRAPGSRPQASAAAGDA